MPRDRSQYRIVSLSGIHDGNLVSPKDYFSFSFNKVPVDLGGIAVFKSPKLLSQHGIEGIGDHGHDHIKVNLDQNGGRKGVEVEKLDRLRDNVFYSPPSGVIANKQFQWCVEVIGNKKSGLLATVSPKDQLSQITLIISQRYKGFMDQRIGVFPFGMGDMDAVPRRKCLGFIPHVLAPTSEGDKAYPLLIERRELVIGSELGVKDKGWFDSPLDLFPEGKETHHLVIGFLAFDVRRCIEDQLGGCILGKKSQRPFHPFVSSSRPVILQDRFLSKVRDGMEVQVDDAAVVELKLVGVLDEALLQPQQVNRIKAVGVCGDGSALGQDIELGKEPRPRIEGMLTDMGIALGAEQLEGHKREKIAECRDHLRSGQSGLFHYLGQIELFDERSEEENAGSLGFKRFLSNIGQSDLLSDCGYLGAFDSHSQLEPRSARKPRVPLFSQDPFNRTDRDLNAFFGQKVRDFSSRQAVLSPIADFSPGVGIDAVPSGFTFRHGLGEVDLFVGEEMSEKVYIADRIPQALGHHLGRQTINKGGAQGLVSALPVMHWMEEKFLVAHAVFIKYDGYSVK